GKRSRYACVAASASCGSAARHASVAGSILNCLFSAAWLVAQATANSSANSAAMSFFMGISSRRTVAERKDRLLRVRTAQREAEGRARPGPRTGPDAPAVAQHHLVHQCQADARALELGRRVQALERA